MSVGCRAFRTGSMVVICLSLAVHANLAQNTTQKPVANSAQATRNMLVEKAHALEARGRPDMAIQLWQQILLSDPNNTESLEGLARDLKLIGSDKATEALDRLRKANPNDPNIAKIEALASTRAESAQLSKAGELARQGKVDDAMRIYRQLYGDRPPDGDIALAYYQTLYGTGAGKQEALTAMRALAERNPGDPRFAVELGIMLTYDQKTRAEGIRELKEHPKDANAQAALRQALIWDSDNPASAAELREYLKEHPQDTDLAGRLKVDESKLAQMNSGIARTPAERAAFAALNSHRLDEAEKRFTELLKLDPHNGRVAAGMGFLRMQQNNFGGAISFLSQAESNGYKARPVEDGLATSRFWYVMGEASQAFDQNQFDVASDKYRQALVMRPSSPEALNGLAGLLTKQQQFSAAAGVYEQLVKVQPVSVGAWRGLFLAYARDNQNEKTTAAQARFPPSVKAALDKDPEYLRTLATLYRAENREADAQSVLAAALALPFPSNGTTLQADTKLEYAGILMEARRYDQAAALYSQVLADDAGDLAAWMGMVSAHHELGQDTQAIADVQKMPPATYEAALADPGFLSMLGAIYQQANQFEVAQGLLERSAKLQIAAGGQPSVALQLQLAGIYLQRNDTAQAYGIYQHVLKNNPDRVDAWKGLIAALQATNRNSEALEEIALIPAPVRKQLDADIEFVQSEASLYAAAGDVTHAIEYMNRVESHYAKLHTEAPANIEIQNAWLLFNTKNDRVLYPVLMRLGGRGDLTVTQRVTVQDIWAKWSVLRAAAAMDNGNYQRAVDILDAASQAFPENLTVRKAVAGGYVQVGRAKESLALYKTIPMQDATADDFQGAVGAALAANDKNQAEQWLRQALERYPRDPAILSLAAHYEQARGDNQRAADYYRASLAAMPSASPAEKLAHVLVYPDQDTRARRAVTAADLQHLLDPDYEPYARTTKVAPLPAYGPDPYNGSAPVVLTPRRPSSEPAAEQQAPDQNIPPPPPPAASQSGSGSAPIYSPQSWAPSASQTADQRLYRPLERCRIRTGKHLSGAKAHVELAAPAARLKSCPFKTTSRMAVSGQVLRAPDHNRARLLRGAFEINTRQRLQMHAAFAGYGYFRTASIVARAAPAAHAAPRMVQASLGKSQVPVQSDSQSVQLSLTPPHSMASDTWKGLIFSLMASNRNAEALAEMAKIPPDVRQQLEADLEFAQGEASLYISAGDIQRGTEYLNRVESFYLSHHTAVPSGLELQHGWLLYTVGDDKALYPVLLGLDTRADLTPAQREQVETLWASWAVRRAEFFLNNGNLLRGVQLLQAASEDYPNNMSVRSAVAGAYAKVGRPADALALFKTIPMQDATSGDYQGAIAAALGATDMAQAETWLRQALVRFPSDAQILALAARFEQARGNTARSADFWRASLAAMPPGAAATKLDSGLVPQGSFAAPRPGDLKRLLDPRIDPSAAKADTLPRLPAYGPNNSVSHTPNSAPASPAAAAQQGQPQSRTQASQWIKAPSSNPLPLPVLPAPGGSNPGAGLNPGAAPGGQKAAASNPPIYAPQSSIQQKPLSQPGLVEQGSKQPANIRTETSRTQAGNQAQPVSKANSSSSNNQSPYMGKMNVPPSEETIGSTGHASAGAASQSASAPPVWTPKDPSGGPNPAPGLRITSRPMGQVAAQAQALFADQTDGQLMQGSASAIHNLPNSAVAPAVDRLPSLKATPAGTGKYNVAQYTPSAQEAATGAYSAPKQQQATPQTAITPQASATPQQCVPQQCPALNAKPSATKKKKKAAAQPSAPTLDQAQQQPNTQPNQAPQQDQVPAEIPAPAPAPTTDTGLTDEELQQRNLPPLRGPWVRIQRQPNPVSPRDEAEMQLRAIESGYSPWMGGTGLINYRSGSLGYDHLAALEAPFELSMPLGYNARLTIVAKPVFLDSGQADGTSVITVQESTAAGSSLVTIPQPIGTLTNTATTPPAQQNAVGVGGELQLTFPHLALAAGYTPAGFLVATFTGRAMWKPGNGPITLNFSRDPVRDTQLSYSGLRDPNGDTLGTLGQIWGGVVANQGTVQFAHGDAESGFYLGGGGQYLSGYTVETNIRFDGSGGAYWRMKAIPEYGNLSIGVNFFAMHYAHNEDAFTHGMGGYFSPAAYFLANIPFTWVGHYGTHWHYNILGSLGVQGFQENLTPLWPLAVDKALETSMNNAMLPAKTSVGPNYDVRSQVAYQIGPHWFAGGFFSANNSRNYAAVSAGFSIHYIFRAQPSTATTPTGIFPTEGLRPFAVP
jgi:tetratricopeptide (TPR) repeat protein